MPNPTEQGCANQHLALNLVLSTKFYWKQPRGQDTSRSPPLSARNLGRGLQPSAHRVQPHPALPHSGVRRARRAPHQLVPLFRQQGVPVLELPDDGAQLCDFKLETPGILFIQLLFLKQKSTAKNCWGTQREKPGQIPTRRRGDQSTFASGWRQTLGGGGPGTLLGAGAPGWQAVRWDRMQQQKCPGNAHVEGEGMQKQASRPQRAQKASAPAHACLGPCCLPPHLPPGSAPQAEATSLASILQ